MCHEVARRACYRFGRMVGHFKTDEEARGAFELAYQQGRRAHAVHAADWMGLTNDEYEAWMCASAYQSATVSTLMRAFHSRSCSRCSR